MNIYVISDNFCDLVSSPDIHHTKWDDYRPHSLGGYRCVLVDMTFDGVINRRVNTSRTLYDLVVRFSVKDYLSNHDLIVVVICGAPNEDLEVVEDDMTDDSSNRPKPTPFQSYDFLKPLIPLPDHIAYDEGNHIYPIVMPGPVSGYLTACTSGTTYLTYAYDPKNRGFAEVIPLAQIKKNVNDCVAFECRDGRGLIVVLPAYDTAKVETVFATILEICKTYIRRKDVTYEATIPNNAIPERIRKYYFEALTCIKTGLYESSTISCRKALEMSTVDLGANPEAKNLNTMLRELAEKNIVDPKLHELANQIRWLGNLGAHASKYEDIQITEEDAMNGIEYLKIFFDYVYVIPKRIEESKAKVTEFNRREGR